MTMNFSKKYKIATGFEKMFEFESLKEELLHDAKIIQMKILHALAEYLIEPITKKELAQLLETSPSYITQLYNGDKLMNLEMISRIQAAFNLEFEITVKPQPRERLTSALVSSKKNDEQRNKKLEKVKC
jgi:plasmid maintenance system antidote protein VapI